jgi:hypothetical protein
MPAMLWCAAQLASGVLGTCTIYLTYMISTLLNFILVSFCIYVRYVLAWEYQLTVYVCYLLQVLFFQGCRVSHFVECLNLCHLSC